MTGYKILLGVIRLQQLNRNMHGLKNCFMEVHLV